MEDYSIEIDIKPKTIIETPFILLMHSGILRIKKGYCWDGPSGPTIDTESFMRGSLVHDVLYQLMRDGHLIKEYREYADRFLRIICLEDGMARWRAWYVYYAVRWFAGRYLNAS
jgi:hypothetical protein